MSNEKHKEPNKKDLAVEANKAAENDQKVTELDQRDQQIVELKEANDQLEDKFLRAQAEIANMQNRYNKERSQLLKYSGQQLALAILPSIDNLKRALEVKADDEASNQLKKGVEMVFNQLTSGLKENGIEEIDSIGTKFDPNLHQAVSVEDAGPDEGKDIVKQVLQPGYKLKDRVIRPAMVVVTK